MPSKLLAVWASIEAASYMKEIEETISVVVDHALPAPNGLQNRPPQFLAVVLVGKVNAGDCCHIRELDRRGFRTLGIGVGISWK